jgi:TalC/MipB family fructose-6-phosphate aldolase
MALYVDSAYLDDIRNVSQTIPLAGVTTNPTILLASRNRGQTFTPLQLLRELLREVNGDIFMQPGETEEEEMFKQAMTYIEADPDRVIPKIPMNLVGMRVARLLKRTNRRIAFTAVTSVAQAYSAAMVQADFIIPYYNRLERSGQDASERISEMAELLHNARLPTRILAASIKSSSDAVCALSAGAHDITAAPSVLLDMVNDPQTEEAIEQFTRDWQSLL